MRALPTLLLALAPAAPAQDERPPNVVLLLADDAGYADFGFQGATDLETPHLDALAARGVRCTQAYVTASVCSPSRAGLIAGRHQQRFGYYLNLPTNVLHPRGLPVSEVTVADRLSALGLRTGVVGKWHLGERERYRPARRGFDESFVVLKGSRGYFPLDDPGPDRVFRRNGEPAPEEGYATERIADEAVAFVERNADGPFFLYVAFTAVHTPMHAREADLARFPDVEPERRRRLAAMTLALDEAVGRILAALDDAGVADDTLVVFTNDNGGATNNACSNAPLRGYKGNLAEGGIRVPFVAAWPGRLPEGATYDSPVSTLDLAPTFVAAAGGEPDGALAGVDLVPFLDGSREERPHDVLYWAQNGFDAVRVGDRKLLRLHFSGGPRHLLFDLAADPGETRDLADSEPETVGRLAAALDRWAAGNAPPRFRATDGLDDATLRSRLRAMDLPVENPATTPVPRHDHRTAAAGWLADDRWTRQHEDCLSAARARAAEDPDVDLVLLGGASLQGFGGPGRDVWSPGADARGEHLGAFAPLNLAIAGDRTEHVLWRLADGALDGLRPRVVALSLGAHHVGEHTVTETVEGIAAVVDDVLARCPGARVLVLTPPARDSGRRAEGRRTHARIARRVQPLGERERVRVLDATDAFLDGSGELRAGRYAPDHVALSPEGLAAWAAAFAPVVRELVGG